MKLRNLIIVIALLMGTCITLQAQEKKGKRKSYKAVMSTKNPEFFKTDDARRIGEQVLLFQRVTGGWPKNTDMVTPLNYEQAEKVKKEKKKTDDSTVDNHATTREMLFLANLYDATKETKFRDAVRKGFEYLLSGQYENGGWPQFWPNPQGYQVHITYNDDNIVNILKLFIAVANNERPFKNDIVDEVLKNRIKESTTRAIDCILKTQIRVKGKPTVWCQQHYKDSFEPAPARAFELPSYCSAESARLIEVLMSLPNPDKRIIEAVNGAMAWFEKYKVTGYKIVRTGDYDDLAGRDTKMVADENAAPMWGRFYDLEYCEPFVVDRDGVMRRRIEAIGFERRSGYAWYTESPALLYEQYDSWAEKYCPKKKVRLNLHGKGGNELGIFQLFRVPAHHDKDYDAVVKAGMSIQEAIDKAPRHSTKPYTIFIKKGLYEEKVVVDRPNIVLVGEDKENTVIRIAETEKTKKVLTRNGKEVHHGVVVLTEEADSCVISSLTIYNNYGTTVEPGNTTHQMAVFGRANHTIIVNSNIWADGNDALSLWAEGGNGMYYHADLDLRCKGVDFLCPRGWCYATRCHFFGDGHAMIWHDGRGDKTKKLVITNSTFDAASPTKLGRWHHDSMFYLINCRMSKNVLDSNIQYAYSDKVLDPCPWGERVYYLYCQREGGHSGWLDDNIEKSEEPGTYHSTTASWTFHGKWDPEKHVRDLWKFISY